jgi:predicted RNase H-like HicB family nuclease
MSHRAASVERRTMGSATRRQRGPIREERVSQTPTRRNEDERLFSRHCVPGLNCYPFAMTVRAIVHPAEEGGFWAEVPAMPGCVTQGESIEEVRANLREAIQGWLTAGESTELMTEADQILEVAV